MEEENEGGGRARGRERSGERNRGRGERVGRSDYAAENLTRAVRR